jgi:hypothetical protein
LNPDYLVFAGIGCVGGFEYPQLEPFNPIGRVGWCRNYCGLTADY